MSNKNLFQEAIADAKAVREAALANAKAALEESITPKLKSMLDAKLNEYADEEDMEEGFDTNAFGFDKEDGELEEELNLEAILAELEGDDTLEEAKDKDKDKEKEEEKKKKKMNEAEDEDEAKEDEEEKEEGEEEEMPEDPEELKDFITDIVKDILAGGKSEDMPTEEDEVEVMDEDIDINELLAELDSLNENEMYEEEKELEEEVINEYIGMSPDEMKAMEILGSIIAGGAVTGALSMAAKSLYNKLKSKKAQKGSNEKAPEAPANESAELEEAIETINILRNELNEVNLLNAKLLYVNKIFKAKNLSESQKLNVIAAFDKATTVKETKLVYESLNKSISAASAKKTQIKESIGFASKAVGVAPKQQIIESNDVISRMQRLANIK